MWLLFLVFLFLVGVFWLVFFEEGKCGMDWRAGFANSGLWGLS